MGADHRLLAPQMRLAGDVVVPPWIAPQPNETLPDYARRFAEALDVHPPLFIGGVSFGGVVAQELARHLPADGIILIATCRRLRQIPKPYRFLGWLGSRGPAWGLGGSVWLASHTRRLFGIQTDEQARLFDQMLADTDLGFLRWSLCALARWKGGIALDMPFIQIHGAKDRIIPRRKVHPTHVIDGAGHIVNVTHSDQVNRLIDRWMRYVVSSTSSPSTTSTPLENVKS